MKEKLGSNATFTGAGKGISYVGDCAYAYSGVVSVNQNENEMVVFQSPKGYIKASTMFNYISSAGTELYAFRIYFNGVQIQGTIQGRHDYESKFESDLKLIIPPLTEVKLTAQNVSNTESHDMIVSLTGRVY